LRYVRIIESTATLGAVRHTSKVVWAAGGAAVGDAVTARTEVVARLVREVGCCEERSCEEVGGAGAVVVEVAALVIGERYEVICYESLWSVSGMPEAFG
jgi:hypothetical protein